MNSKNKQSMTGVNVLIYTLKAYTTWQTTYQMKMLFSDVICLNGLDLHQKFPGQAHCIVCKTLNSNSAYIHPGFYHSGGIN